MWKRIYSRKRGKRYRLSGARAAENLCILRKERNGGKYIARNRTQSKEKSNKSNTPERNWDKEVIDDENEWK